MSRKIIGILIILVALLVMGGVVYVIFFGQSPLDRVISWFNRSQPAVPAETAPPGPDGSRPSPARPPIQVVTVEEDAAPGARPAQAAGVTREDLARLAASFAERFGTYSNQSNFSNLVDLKIFMSTEMKSWSDAFMSEQRSRQSDNSLYYGITTKAVAQEALAFDDDLGAARVKVSTRRREATGTVENQAEPFSQDVIIEFTKESGAWKVKSAYWQN